MKSLLLFLVVLTSIPAQSIEIENFKSGLMCGINKEDMGWVCFEQEEIKITGQSSCISDGEEFKCTWYGYSFNYKDAKPNQKLIASIGIQSQQHLSILRGWSKNPVNILSSHLTWIKQKGIS